LDERRGVEKMKYVLQTIVRAMLETLGCSLGTAIWSKVQTGDWSALLQQTSWTVWACIGVAFLVFHLVHGRLRNMRNALPGPILLTSNSFLPRTVVGKVTHAGVVWTIVAPGPLLWHDPQRWTAAPFTIEAVTPPLCPKCGTEIEETPSFWGGVKWTCIACDFRKRNLAATYLEADRAGKIARREIEKGQ
jgi:hypothetical protein